MRQLLAHTLDSRGTAGDIRYIVTVTTARPPMMLTEIIRGAIRLC